MYSSDIYRLPTRKENEELKKRTEKKKEEK